MEDPGGPSTDILPSDVQRPVPADPVDPVDEREAIFAELEGLKKQGLKFRAPNKSLSIEKLRARRDEIVNSKKKLVPPPKVVAKPAPKPVQPVKLDPPPPRVYSDSDSDSDSDFDSLFSDSDGGVPPRTKGKRIAPIGKNKKQKGPPTIIHMLYYSTLSAGGRIATHFGHDEFSKLGEVASQNKPALDPVLDELAEELGVDMGDPLPAPARLAMMTGLMAGACYKNARPGEIPPPVEAAIDVGGAFFELNLRYSGSKK